MFAQYTEKSGKSEVGYFRSLYSESADNPHAPTPRLRYAILAQARTGSELVSAYLRRRGMGVPLEYFHGSSLQTLAVRWDCMAADGTVDFGRYRAALERLRTTPNAAFGIKIIMDHLDLVTSRNPDVALEILQSFDKILLMRRRDTLRQGISLMRAMSTGQWHVLPGDEHKPLAGSNVTLSFARITYCWARVLGQERDMAMLEARLPASKLRTVWYEDLSGSPTLPAIANWLCAGSGIQPQPEAPDHPLPMQGDSREAAAVLKTYMDYIGVEPP